MLNYYFRGIQKNGDDLRKMFMSVNDTKYHHLSFSSLYHWKSKMKGKDKGKKTKRSKI